MSQDSAATTSNIPLRSIGLDAVRGIALFGILVANIRWTILYSTPADELSNLSTATLDMWIGQAVLILIEKKFYTLFSILFGIGFALQWARSVPSAPDPTGHQPSSFCPDDKRFRTLFIRRIAWLFLFGALHLTFLWLGDVLYLYAIAAIPLWFLRKIPVPWLIPVALVLCLPAGWAWQLAPQFFPDIPGITLHHSFDYFQWDADVAIRRDALQSPSYGSIPEVHVHGGFVDFWKQGYAVEFIVLVVGRFLLGLWVGRSGLLAPTPEAARRRIRFLAIGGPIGLIAAACAPWSHLLWLESVHASWIDPVFKHLLEEVAALGIAGAILTGIIEYNHRRPMARWTHCLAAPGRMPLTQYLFQSLLYVFLFYEYAGPCWLGEVGVWICGPVAIVFFAVQIITARLWFSYFQLGPMEWLWRCLTHQRKLPIRKERSQEGRFSNRP